MALAAKALTRAASVVESGAGGGPSANVLTPACNGGEFQDKNEVASVHSIARRPRIATQILYSGRQWARTRTSTHVCAPGSLSSTSQRSLSVQQLALSWLPPSSAAWDCSQSSTPGGPVSRTSRVHAPARPSCASTCTGAARCAAHGGNPPNCGARVRKRTGQLPTEPFPEAGGAVDAPGSPPRGSCATHRS